MEKMVLRESVVLLENLDHPDQLAQLDPLDLLVCQDPVVHLAQQENKGYRGLPVLQGNKGAKENLVTKEK